MLYAGVLHLLNRFGANSTPLAPISRDKPPPYASRQADGLQMFTVFCNCFGKGKAVSKPRFGDPHDALALKKWGDISGSCPFWFNFSMCQLSA